MKTLKKIVLIIAFSFPILVNAQVTVNESGNLIVGNITPPHVGIFDRDHISKINIFGPHSDWRAGGKLTFGDFTGRFNGGFNVFVGEYTDSIDTDLLWLHGKHGIYYTRGGKVDYVVAYYDYNTTGNQFNFLCDIQAQGLFVNSDKELKKDIQRIPNSLSLVQQLTGVSYHLKSSENNVEAMKKNHAALSEKEQRDDLLAKKADEKEKQRLEQKRMGFIAQDLQKVFPDLVKENDEGLLSVDYIGLIPVLVEALKEQQAQIEELKSAVPSKGSLRSASIEEESTGIPFAGEMMTEPALYQNTPNPFNVRTEIRYSLTGRETSAMIYIFNMQGSLIKKHLTDGSGILSIEASELTPGMYIYTLVADGKEVDTKRMILTN